MLAFPGLCQYYDQFFYSNQDLSDALQKEDDMLLLAFKNQQRTNNWAAFDTVDDLFSMTNMSTTESEEFMEAVLTYCKANLVRIIVYIPSPYVTTYKTDQVCSNIVIIIIVFIFLQAMTLITFIANLGGMLGLCMGPSLVSIIEIAFYAAQYFGGETSQNVERIITSP